MTGKKDQRIEAGSRLGWQRMQRAGPTRPIYSAILEPFWPCRPPSPGAPCRRPTGIPGQHVSSSAIPLHLERTWGNSGASLEQVWSKSGAILEHPGAERHGEDGDASGGMGRMGKPGGEGIECRRDPPGTLAGFGATSVPHSSPVRCSEPPRGGVMPQLLGGILQGPIPAATQLAHRAPPPQSRCGQRASVRANADERCGATAAKYLPARFAPSRG